MTQPTRIGSEQSARAIREYMGGEKIKRSELAARVGLSRQSITNKLDNVTPITVDELDRILDELGLGWDWLIDRIGLSQRNP